MIRHYFRKSKTDTSNTDIHNDLVKIRRWAYLSVENVV